jgi:outer membrane lipoprotein carrier protein
LKNLLLAIAVLIAGDGNLSENEIVAKVEKQFADVRTMTAAFNQTFYDATIGETEQSSGRVWIKKPLKMKWQYDKPYEQTILSDGKKIYFHFPSDRQVLVESVDNIIDSRSPVLFLAGKYALKELFRIRLERRDEKDKMNHSIRLELIPKEKSVSATKVVLTVDDKSWNIRSFSIFDWTGNRTDIEFIGAKINGKISGEEFRFVPPKGVEIMQMPRPDFGVNE